jgi:hypothetical protein
LTILELLDRSAYLGIDGIERAWLQPIDMAQDIGRVLEDLPARQREERGRSTSAPHRTEEVRDG